MFITLKSILVMLAICCTINFSALGQCTHTISIRVSNGAQQPLSNVLIKASPALYSLKTDEHGRLTIPAMCLGKHRIESSLLGYKNLTVDLQLSRDTTLNLVLVEDVIHLKDVVITGIRSSSLSSSLHSLSKQKLQESKGKVLADALTAISGVSTLNTGSNISKPVINGLHGNRILVLNQGIRQEGQQWGAEHAPEIDPFTADQIAVVKGAQGVRYGADALGGVVLLSSKAIDKSSVLSGAADLIGNSNGRGISGQLRLEGGFRKRPELGWRLQGSSKRTGNLKSADYYLGNTAAQELNFSGSLHYQLPKGSLEAYGSHFGTELGIFSGAHIGTVEDIMVRIAHGRPFEDYAFSYAIDAPKQAVTHDLAKVKWTHNFDGQRSLETVYAFQKNHRQEYDLRRVASDDTPMADMVLTTQTLEAIYRFNQTSIGAQGSLQVHNNTPGTGTTPIIPNYDNYTAGLFMLHQFHIQALHVELGGRYDYRLLDVAGYRYQYERPNPDGSVNQVLLTDSRSFHNASGTAGILYHFNANTHWKSNLGLAWRAPSANELYSDGVHHGSGTYEIGQRDLKSEKGLKWMNTLLYENKKFNLVLDIFGQLIYDYIYAQPNADSVRQTIRGTFPIFSYQQHNALFYGADIALSYALHRAWTYQANIGLVQAKNMDLKSYLPYIPSNRVNQSIQWNMPHSMAKDSYIKLSHRFVDRQRRYTEGSDYVAPPAAYHLFDITAGSTLGWQNQSLHINATVSNIFNHAYKDYMDRFRYYAHQQGRNIAIKLSYTF